MASYARHNNHTVTVVAEHLLLDKVQGRVDDAAAVTNARGGLVQAEGERRNGNMLLYSFYVTPFILTRWFTQDSRIKWEVVISAVCCCSQHAHV